MVASDRNDRGPSPLDVEPLRLFGVDRQIGDRDATQERELDATSRVAHPCAGTRQRVEHGTQGIPPFLEVPRSFDYLVRSAVTRNLPSGSAV